MWTKILDWSDDRHHRLSVLVLLWSIGSWFVLLPYLKFSQLLLSIQSLNELTQLATGAGLTPVSRLVANLLDHRDLWILLSTSFTFIEGCVLILEALLMINNPVERSISKTARLQWLSGLILILCIFILLILAIRSRNPNMALFWIKTAGYLCMGGSLLRILHPFVFWIRLSFDSE